MDLTDSTILVVDDEIALVDLVRGYLAHEGFTVLVAHDGLSALDLALTRHPDLVVLDVMLPGRDGIEVCRRLRQFSDAYVLMLTARSEEIDTLNHWTDHPTQAVPKSLAETIARL